MDGHFCFETILALSRKVALLQFAVPGICWRGYFIDSEGNTFGLFQVDETAKWLRKRVV